MRATLKVIIIIIPIVIFASLLFVYLISLSFVSSGEIDAQVENLQTNYRQDFSKEIGEYPAYRVISEVLGEPSVKEMYRDYLEALYHRSGTEANNMYERFKSYIETRAETKFKQEYPSESFADNLGELFFGKK
jgi:membrane-bound acyltransferase YfiQ involved in biofilm formation